MSLCYYCSFMQCVLSLSFSEKRSGTFIWFTLCLKTSVTWKCSSLAPDVENTCFLQSESTKMPEFPIQTTPSLTSFQKKTMNINEPSFQNVSLRIPGWTRNKLFRVNEAVCMAGARNLKRGIFEGVFGFLGILFETSLGIRSAHRT